MTDKEIDRIIKANIKMAGFVSLVKKMREAQKKCDRFIYREIKISFDEYQTKEEILNLEDEVDEYLKKMEV